MCLSKFHYFTVNSSQFLVDFNKPCYVRVGRAAVPDVYANDDFHFELGTAITVVDGNDLTLVATGETVYHAWQAALQLKEQGISARVLDMSWTKPFDQDAILKAAKETGRIVTIEEHSQFGGLGAMVCEMLSEHPVPVRIIGIPDENVVHGTNAEIFHYYGMDAEGIVSKTLDFINSAKSI